MKEKMIFKQLNIMSVLRCNCYFARSVSMSAAFRPRRSLLYVPGNDTKKILKATNLNADVVVLDFEDGVAINQKGEARRTSVELLPSLAFANSEAVIRVNAIESEFVQFDLEAVLTAQEIPDSIMIPKVQSAEEVQWFRHETERLLSLRSCNKALKVIGQSETPFGLMNLRDILTECLKEHKYLQFEAFVFGSDDYLASIGATRTKDASELLFARQFFIMNVKGFGLQAIDMVDIDFKDLEGLEKHALAGSKMGFTGKQVIHPAQVDIVNKCFSPTLQQIEYAKGLIQAFDNHQKTGKGAFSLHGNMIDMPLLKQAMNTVNLAKAIDRE